MYGHRFAYERDDDEVIYKCTMCANVYDPERDGEGLAFDDLPECWTCPVCVQPKACVEFSRWSSATDNSNNGGQMRHREIRGSPVKPTSAAETEPSRQVIV